MVDQTKLVKNLNEEFPLPVEVLPSAWKQVKDVIEDMDAQCKLRLAEKKAGPVVTDEGN